MNPRLTLPVRQITLATVDTCSNRIVPVQIIRKSHSPRLQPTLARSTATTALHPPAIHDRTRAPRHSAARTAALRRRLKAPKRQFDASFFVRLFVRCKCGIELAEAANQLNAGFKNLERYLWFRLFPQ
jgi:hypothetical protein